MPKKILISSCLIGKKCAYDAEARTNDSVKELCSRFGYTDVCPEMLGGLGCPREVHEIVGGGGGDVLDGKAIVKSSSGEDHTRNFIQGAKETLKEALKNNIRVAIMKSHSPSCGRNEIHSGKFDGAMRKGAGVTITLLLREGIKVFTEGETEKAVEQLES